jgi:hypothetical protein
VEQRIAADEVHAEMASKEKIFQAALRAKTEIYNKLGTVLNAHRV